MDKHRDNVTKNNRLSRPNCFKKHNKSYVPTRLKSINLFLFNLNSETLLALAERSILVIILSICNRLKEPFNKKVVNDTLIKCALNFLLVDKYINSQS